jgi:hypothetical protein
VCSDLSSSVAYEALQVQLRAKGRKGARACNMGALLIIAITSSMTDSWADPIQHIPGIRFAMEAYSMVGSSGRWMGQEGSGAHWKSRELPGVVKMGLRPRSRSTCACAVLIRAYSRSFRPLSDVYCSSEVHFLHLGSACSAYVAFPL